MALYCSPDFKTSFESTGLLVQEKKFNIDFQDGGHGGQHGFPIRMILATSDLHVTDTYYHLLVQEKKFKIDFQHGCHLRFSIGTILAIFDLQVTLILPAKV